MTRSYVDKTFGSKKALLERRKVDEVIYEGGWFGMTHLTYWEHWELFKEVHKEHYPFTVIERDPITHSKIDLIANYKCLHKFEKAHIIKGDVLEGLFNYYPKIGYTTTNNEFVYRKPIYSYGHLDYCCNAIGLTEDGFERNLRRLAKWWGLKRTFHLDITLSRRGMRSDKLNDIMLDQFIPTTFKSCRWSVVRQWKEDYKDTSPMTTAFYVFSRQPGNFNKYKSLQ